LSIFPILVLFTESIAADLSGKIIITPYAGYYFFGEERDHKNRPIRSFKDNYEYGIRFEYFFTPRISALIGYGRIPTDKEYKKNKWQSSTVHRYQLNLIYNFAFMGINRIPFISLGMEQTAGDYGLEFGAGLRALFRKQT